MDVEGGTRGALRDHWSSYPEWRPGRRAYFAYLTFAGEADLGRLARQCQARIDLPTLDLVPPEWLHLTVQAVGFTDEVSVAEAKRVAAAAADHCRRLAPFTLVAGPPWVVEEGVLLGVAGPVEELRTAVRTAITEVLGEDRLTGSEEDAFYPHISLAYSNAAGPATALAETVGSLGLPPANVTVSELELVVVRRQDRTYLWDALANAPLGRRSRPSGV